MKSFSTIEAKPTSPKAAFFNSTPTEVKTGPKEKYAELAIAITKELKIGDEATIASYEDNVFICQHHAKNGTGPLMSPDHWDDIIAEGNYLKEVKQFENGNPDKTDLDSIKIKYKNAPSVLLERVRDYLAKDNTYDILSEIEKTGQTSVDNMKKLKEIRDRSHDRLLGLFNGLLAILEPAKPRQGPGSQI